MDISQINILIVDDHQIMIDGIKSMLKDEENINVVAHANNGKQAIDIIKNIKIDIILMDVEMPIMNGIDATKFIKAKNPDIEIIALTTYDEKSIINIMLEAGAKGYILKNINKDVLLEAINTVYKGELFQDSEVKISLAKSSLMQVDDKEKYSSHKSTDLSNRELDILRNIVNGLSSKEIAEKLFLSPKTVETHRNNIMKKLEVHNTASLVKIAIKSGLVD